MFISTPGSVIHTSRTLVETEDLRFDENFVPVSGCSQGTFCNDTEDYPSLVVNIVRSLDEKSLLRELFNQRAEETTSRLRPIVSDILTQESSATLPPGSVLLRTSNPQYSPPSSPLLEEVLCEERVDYHYPRKAQTKHKEWRYVSNTRSSSLLRLSPGLL